LRAREGEKKRETALVSLSGAVRSPSGHNAAGGEEVGAGVGGDGHRLESVRGFFSDREIVD
jgi:hypothetical protein